jgi:hypothetical protein
LIHDVNGHYGTKPHFDDILLARTDLFCLDAESSTFTAAELATVSLRPASRSISRLEERLAVRLFVRSTRSVRLTDSGKVYFEHSRGA